MELSVNQQYRLNRLVLSAFGIWPYQSPTTNTWIKRILTFLFLMWSVSVQVIKICMSELTIDFLLDCLPVIIPNIGAILQFLYRIIINDKLRDLFDQIKIDWEYARSEDEMKIMQASATGARIATKLFLLYMFIGITMYMLTTFIPQILDVFLPLNESRSREHPFHAEFFLDEEKYFYTVRFLMYLFIVFVLAVVLANGTIFVVYMQHACGMFTILGFVDIIQSCYGLSLFLEFLCSMILLGITLVQVIKFSGTSDRSIRSVAYISGQLVYMFMYSYMGQQLINKSTQLSTKIYSAEWYSISVWKQKMMLCIMLKCTRMISINAYNIFIMSLESFSSIVQSAVSVSMLLRRM